jgi:hypothetical protein
MAKAKEWKPRRVRSEDERGSGSSQYITLDEGQKFLGYALFEGDPAEDEPGYYEYLEHWDTGARRSIPCAGDDCPFCEDGDKPKDRAKTLWLVTKNEKGDVLDPPELRIFNFNSILIKQITEMRGEGDKIFGRLFRVTRTDDRGNYVLMPKDDMKSKDAPDFDAMVTSQLRKAMEGIAVARAMDDDDDDDDEDEKPKGKSKKTADKSKPKAKKAEASDEWPDDGLDEVTVTVAKVEKAGQWIEVASDDYDGKVKVWTTDDIEFDLTDLSKDDEVTVSAEGPDDDGDYILNTEPEVVESAEPEDEDEDETAKDEDDAELPDGIEDEQFEVVSVDADESTIELTNDEFSFTLYFLDTMEVDFDDYETGTKVKVSAEKDSQGDLVATEVPDIVKDKKKSAGKSGAKKGSGGKSKSKAKGGKGKK